MYQAMLLDRIEKIRKLLINDTQTIAQQRRVVADLAKTGHATYFAKKLLAKFEKLHEIHGNDQRRLEKELIQISH